MHNSLTVTGPPLTVDLLKQIVELVCKDASLVKFTETSGIILQDADADYNPHVKMSPDASLAYREDVDEIEVEISMTVFRKIRRFYG